MLEIQQQNHFYLFNFDQPKVHQEKFLDIQFWQNENRIIGSAKGRGTTWFIHSEDIFGINTALRHYFRGGLLGKINKDRYAFSSLEQTRSFAEFKLLHQLHQAGLPVPQPVAAKVEKLNFNQYRADLLSERIENAKDLTAVLQTKTISTEHWQQIGQLIRQLHNLQICHTDLNAHNILLQTNQQHFKFWLIDFDKCGEKSGNFWKQENLQRLHRSFCKEVKRMQIQFTEQNWQDLLTGYHQ
ncbi:3-deoxy-D-manno-octulosonic acid kinase [Pasteurella bettyae]|uniref:3-deoxy-D-manno-octulosonic acid kinase n=1 Tax=Pasteurella bettyae TaxID=752 RepID=UPI003D26E6CB